MIFALTRHIILLYHKCSKKLMDYDSPQFRCLKSEVVQDYPEVVDSDNVLPAWLELPPQTSFVTISFLHLLLVLLCYYTPSISLSAFNVVVYDSSSSACCLQQQLLDWAFYLSLREHSEDRTDHVGHKIVSYYMYIENTSELWLLKRKRLALVHVCVFIPLKCYERDHRNPVS